MDAKLNKSKIPALEGVQNDNSIQIPLPEDGVVDIQRKRKPSPVFLLSYALLALISILLHTAIFANAAGELREKGGELLFSFIVPEYEISSPQVPPLPKESTVKKEEKETTAQQKKKFTYADLSSGAKNGLSLSNETSYAPDLFELSLRKSPVPKADEIRKKYGDSAPMVLIYHTHATEGYRDTQGTSFRSADSEKNTVSIGRLIADTLEIEGIPTMHLTEQFDLESWNDAYDKSNEAVRGILSENPSVKYVFDVHRDCIGNDEEGYVSSETSVKEKKAAQLMFVCGTDEGGSGHSEWRDNLTCATQLQTLLNKNHPTLMRPINLRRASFYQDSSKCSLILECGTCANTKKEAERSAVAFAHILADYINGK